MKQLKSITFVLLLCSITANAQLIDLIPENWFAEQSQTGKLELLHGSNSENIQILFPGLNGHTSSYPLEGTLINFGKIGQYSLGISSTGGMITRPGMDNDVRMGPASRMRTSSAPQYEGKVCERYNDIKLIKTFFLPQLLVGNKCFFDIKKNKSELIEHGYCNDKNDKLLFNFIILYKEFSVNEIKDLKCKKAFDINIYN